MSRTSVLAYLALGCSITAMIAVVGDSGRIQIGEDREEREEEARTRPRSIRERMLEERESAAMGSGRAEEAKARGGDDAEGTTERAAFDIWFYGQRKYPARALPKDAIGKAHGRRRPEEPR